MEQLKPCPFCGAIPTIHWEKWEEISVKSGIYVLNAYHDFECFIRRMNGMNIKGEMCAYTKERLIEVWNRRVTDV